MTETNVDTRAAQPLHVYATALKELGREAFEREHGSYFLLLDGGNVRGPRGMASTTFEPRPAGVAEGPTAPTRFQVLVLRAREGGATVSVGRSDEADVLINDQSVSSVHAVFERGDAGMTLRDNGSKNGTFVDEQILAGPGRGEPMLLGRRHALRFGSLGTVYLDIDGFEELARLFAPDRS